MQSIDYVTCPLQAVTVKVRCAVPATFRVEQARGMFDLKKGMGEEVRFGVQVPAGGEWKIGAIVGPSGSGKSTVARAAFGECVYEPGENWPARKSVLDGFAAGLSIKAITGMLTAVGFSSPPAWLRPYAVLSNGEKFRCDLARALLGEGGEIENRELRMEKGGSGGINHEGTKDKKAHEGGGIVVFDEFTSVVDRRVAQVGSLAVAKAVRGGRCGQDRRLVVVTCHYDVLRWLRPDWVVDMATGKLARGALCRRKCGRAEGLRVEVRACGREWWGMFARHHYLSGALHRNCQCYLATVDGEAVGFCAVGYVFGYPGCRSVSRVVVLPDYQGVGIGGKLLAAVAEITRALPGVRRVGLVTSHPGMIAACTRKGGGWKCVRVDKHGSPGDKGARRGTFRRSTGRGVVGFEWVGGIN